MKQLKTDGATDGATDDLLNSLQTPNGDEERESSFSDYNTKSLNDSKQRYEMDTKTNEVSEHLEHTSYRKNVTWGTLEEGRNDTSPIKKPEKSSTNNIDENSKDQDAPRNMTIKKSDSKMVRGTGGIIKAYSGNWNQTELNSRSNSWMEYLSYTMFALLLQVTLGWDYAFPDGRPACDYEKGGLGTSSTNSRICDLAWTLEQGQLQLRVLAAFVVGGFITNTVYLWRRRRTAYLELGGATRNLIIQLGSLLPLPDDNDDTILAARETMERWAILGFELAVLKARGHIDTIEGKEYLDSMNLLSKDEWDRMVIGDRHTTVWYWVQQKAVNLTDQNIISSELRLQTICTAVSLIRIKANDLMSCIDRDQPMPYSSVVGMLVNLSLLLASLSKGIQWAIWFYDTEGLVWTSPKMYTDIFILLSYTSVFAMLYDISQVLYNPFCQRDIDIPHRIVGDGIRNLAKRIGSNDNCQPSTMDNSSNITQMASVRNMEENVEFDATQVRDNNNYRKNVEIRNSGMFNAIVNPVPAIRSSVAAVRRSSISSNESRNFDRRSW